MSRDSEKRQLVVAELEGNFERFSAEVNYDFRDQWSGILNEVHGYYGDWLGQYRKFEALLAWKEDFSALFIPRLGEMAQDVLALQNWVDTIDFDDGGCEADTENSFSSVERRWPGGALTRRDRGDSHMYYVRCGSGGAV